MANVTRTTTWSDNQVLTASALNGEFNNLLNSLALVNADISASAAIVYSKLNLTGGIVNADIANGAALNYAKLNLVDSVTNTDIYSAAAISPSKIDLTAFTPMILTNSGTGSGLLIDQNGSGTALYVDNAGVKSSIYINQVGQLTTADHSIYVFSDTANHNGQLLKLWQNNGTQTTPIMDIVNVSTADSITESTTGAKLTAAGIWTDASDISKKKDIEPIKYGLEDVLRMQPRNFVFKKTEQKAIGFIAQEMEYVIPEVVSGEEGSKGLDYGALVAVMAKAIQELKAEIEELKEKVG